MSASAYNILFVEDDTSLGETLEEYLKSKNYQCFWAKNCNEARSYFNNNKESISIILLDIGLPDGSGIDLGREFRQQKPEAVIFFLSALNDPNTRLEGLEIGANDYITKPFELKELTLRLDRILKIQKDILEIPSEVVYDDLKIFFKKYQIETGDGEVLPLSQKECAILKMLHLKFNQVVSRDDIIDEVWGKESFPSNRTVDNYIVKLRKWCETSKVGKLKITSVRGIGYKLEKDDM